MPDGSIKGLNTAEAKIELADLPFIRLGNKISLHGMGFRELVLESQNEIDTATIQPELTVNLAQRFIKIGNTIIEMVPVELMIYTAFLRLKIDNCKYPDWPYCLDCNERFLTLVDFSRRSLTEKMAKDSKKIYLEQNFKVKDFLKRWDEGIDEDIISQNISKINRTLKEKLADEILLPYYQITSLKRYCSSRYGIWLEKSNIRIE